MSNSPIKKYGREFDEKAIKACETFVTLIIPQMLSLGTRNLFLYYVQYVADREDWFDEYVVEIKVLFDFLDELMKEDK